MRLFVPMALSLMPILFHLGGLGLLAMGIVDNSVIPTFGGEDVLTVILVTARRHFWWYYAIMAIVGSVIGGYLTYQVGRQGGKEALEHRFRKRTLKRIYKSFDRWGFAAIVLFTLLPPPTPTVPFLMGAGALNYPVRKYLTAISLGRSVRYSLLAYLASLWGDQIFDAIKAHFLIILLILLGTTGIAVLLLFLYRDRKKPRQ